MTAPSFAFDRCPSVFISGSKRFPGYRLDLAKSRTRMSANGPFGNSAVGIHCPIFLRDPPFFLRVLRVDLFRPSLPFDENLQSCASVFPCTDYWKRPVTPGSKQKYRFILAMNQVLDPSKQKEQRGELMRKAEDRRGSIGEWAADRIKPRHTDDKWDVDRVCLTDGRSCSSPHVINDWKRNICQRWTAMNSDEKKRSRKRATSIDPIAALRGE